MDASKQRGSIVLTKQNIDGQDYIRIEYTDNQTIALLLSQDKGIKTIGNGSAYIQASTFQLPEFYTRYSPHAYIDYSRVYIRHPKPQREYVLPKGYLELLEQKRYSPSTIKTYRIYFSDFMEYHKGRNIDRLKVADINHYILYLVNEKKISVSQQNMRINAIKFYFERVKGGKCQYYGGITGAKEYKTPANFNARRKAVTGEVFVSVFIFSNTVSSFTVRCTIRVSSFRMRVIFMVFPVFDLMVKILFLSG